MRRKSSAPPQAPRLGDYEVLRCLGKGSFGQVFAARRAGGGEEEPVVAIKVMSKAAVVRRKQVEHTLAERFVMAQLADHPNILALRHAFQTPSQLCLVSDFCPGGELFFHLERLGRFPVDTARLVCAQTCDALVHLHNSGVAYRDLKSENMLLDANGNVRLADFGLAKLDVSEQRGARTLCGSAQYMAPEMLLCRRSQPNRAHRRGYGYMVDWWSFGTLMYDVLVGRPPFYHPDKAIMIERLLSTEPVVFPRELPLPACAKSLMAGLLRRDPRRRLGAASRGGATTLYNHPFFAQINWTALRAGKAPPSELLATSQKAQGVPMGGRAAAGSGFGGGASRFKAALRNFDRCFTNAGVAAALESTSSAGLGNDAIAAADHAAFMNWDTAAQTLVACKSEAMGDLGSCRAKEDSGPAEPPESALGAQTQWAIMVA